MSDEAKKTIGVLENDLIEKLEYFKSDYGDKEQVQELLYEAVDSVLTLYNVDLIDAWRSDSFEEDTEIMEKIVAALSNRLHIKGSEWLDNADFDEGLDDDMEADDSDVEEPDISPGPTA